MTPREFLDTVVQPNVAEFSENYDDVRRAFNAVASVDALAAYLYQHLRSSNHPDVDSVSDDSQYRAELATQHPDFGLLRDVAKAHKHVRLVRGNPEVSGADQTEVKSLAYGEARYGEGRFGSPDQVVVVTDSGENRVIESLVAGCVKFLDGRLKHYNI